MKGIEIIPEAVQSGIEVTTQHEVFEKMAAPLLSHDFVKQEYEESVERRETKFPTGMPLIGVGVAIPHTDPEHVNSSAISIATLKKPVSFEVMGSPGQHVDVSVVFMLALCGGHKHLEMLQKIVGIIQEPRELGEIIASGSDAELLAIVKRQFDE